MKKILIILMVSVFMLSGCSSEMINAISEGANSAYEDDERIAGTSNSYNKSFSLQQSKNGHLTGTVKNMQGMDTIWKYKAKEDMELQMDYLLNNKAGQVKLVLILPDDSLVTLVEVNEDSEKQEEMLSETVTLLKGMNRIKLVAKDAEEIEYELNIPEGSYDKED